MADEAFSQPLTLTLWKAVAKAKQGWIGQGKFFQHQLGREDFDFKPSNKTGLTRAERQWMCASGDWPGGGGFFIHREAMRQAMAAWRYPLHFIDFETARVPIPFHAGQKPYGNIAFQFSHHVMHAVGSVAHQSEFLALAPGKHPNVDFIRALKASLGEAGTVFMWSMHEQTTLAQLLQEIQALSPAPDDLPELCAFIGQLLPRSEGTTAGGERQLVDLCELAERAFFHPATAGSSSIKKVLAAVLGSSSWLRALYSQPVYGAPGGMASLNFSSMAWWQVAGNGLAMDPYKLLPPVILGQTTGEGGVINQGGAATSAYARLQGEEAFESHHALVAQALLRYCELDTLAMVMVVQAWKEWLVS